MKKKLKVGKVIMFGVVFLFSIENSMADNINFLNHLNKRVSNVNEKRSKAKATTFKHLQDQVKNENEKFLQKLKKSADEKTFNTVSKEIEQLNALTDKEIDEEYRKKILSQELDPKNSQALSDKDQVLLSSLNTNFSDLIKSKTINHKSRVNFDNTRKGQVATNTSKTIKNSQKNIAALEKSSEDGDKNQNVVLLNSVDQDQKAIKEALKNKKSNVKYYQKNEQDSLFETITKTYINSYDKLIKNDDLEN